MSARLSALRNDSYDCTHADPEGDSRGADTVIQEPGPEHDMRECLGIFLRYSLVLIVCTVLAVFASIAVVQKYNQLPVFFPPFDLCAPVMRMILCERQ